MTFIVAYHNSDAQATKYGIKVGIISANQRFANKPASLKVAPITSFNIQFLADFNITSSLSIQSGLGVSGKGSKVGSSDAKLRTSLLYAELPLNFIAKVPTAAKGYFFFGAGPYVAYALSGRTKLSGLGADQIEEDIFSDDGFKRSDYGLNIITGVEFRKGVTVNFNYGLGLNDISGQNISKVKNTWISASIGFLL